MASAGEDAQYLTSLSSYRRCTLCVREQWPGFLHKRQQRLEQQRRLGEASEKVAENILEDLFTVVLDWSLSDFNNQVEFADIVLTDHGVRRLIVEVKRPGTLTWHRPAIECALAQAIRYGGEQRVKTIAVSDGMMLYAADVETGGLRDRLFVSLSAEEPQLDLWWLSTQGIWRERHEVESARLRLLAEEPVARPAATGQSAGCEELLHPKYHLPARCFAYVGDYGHPNTWKLPYLLGDGTVDGKRLPKAAQALLSNYRGAKVSGIPDKAIGAVLNRLAQAARQAGHMPPEACNPAPIYRQLAEALEQFETEGQPTV